VLAKDKALVKGVSIKANGIEVGCVFYIRLRVMRGAIVPIV